MVKQWNKIVNTESDHDQLSSLLSNMGFAIQLTKKLIKRM